MYVCTFLLNPRLAQSRNYNFIYQKARDVKNERFVAAGVCPVLATLWQYHCFGLPFESIS